MDQVAPHRARVYGRQRRTGLYHLIKNTNSRCSSGCESYDPYVIVQTVGYLASEYHVRSIPASVFLCRTREYKRIQVSILEGTHTSMSCHPPPHKGVASSEWLSDAASRWSMLASINLSMASSQNKLDKLTIPHKSGRPLWILELIQ